MRNNKNAPPRTLALFFGVGAGLVLLGLLFILRPIERKEALLRFKLWRAGAHTLVWEKHRGFTLDRCGGKSPSECECIWFIHGLGDSVTTWKNVFLSPDAFSEKPLRLFAIDLPGHGGSPRRKNLEEYRASKMARELDLEIEKNTLCTRNVLVGNSFGGWVVTWMAIQEPSHYSHLILLSPAGTEAASRATEGLFQTPTAESLKEFQRRAYFKPRPLSEKEWSLAADRMRAGGVDEVRSVQTPEDRLDGELPKLSVPTAVVWGSADRVLPREVMRSFTDRIPHATFTELLECGHLPQKECPAKLFAAIRKVL